MEEQGRNSDELHARFSCDRPSMASRFRFRSITPKDWWTTGLLVPCGDQTTTKKKKKKKRERVSRSIAEGMMRRLGIAICFYRYL